MGTSKGVYQRAIPTRLLSPRVTERRATAVAWRSVGSEISNMLNISRQSPSRKQGDRRPVIQSTGHIHRIVGATIGARNSCWRLILFFFLFFLFSRLKRYSIQTSALRRRSSGMSAVPETVNNKVG